MSTFPESPSDRGRPTDGLLHDQRRARRPNTAASLRRSETERVLAGVCGGIATYVDAAPSVVRAVFVLSLLPSIGVTGLGYLLLWWLLPSGA
ncbi:MAG: PspC domain-containing protein [Deinococcales bacterium]